MLIEIILGERPPTGVKTPIEYSVVNEGFRANINGEAVFEPVALLRDRVDKLRARDNLLGAVLARLGADPGARETAAHAAVGKLLERSVALERVAKILDLSFDHPDEMVEQVAAQHEEITSALTCSRLEAEALTEALAKAQDEVKRLKEQLGGMTDLMKRERASHALEREEASCEYVARMNSAEAEAAKLRAELEASAKALEAANAKRERDFNAAREAQREIEKLKIKLAETDLDRVLAEARVSGLAAELQALEHALRDKIGDLPF